MSCSFRSGCGGQIFRGCVAERNGTPSRQTVLHGPSSVRRGDRLDGDDRDAAAAIGGVAALALVLLGVAVAGASGPPGAGPPAGPPTTAVLKTTTINGATVLTNGKGLILYWFAPDTSARSG